MKSQLLFLALIGSLAFAACSKADDNKKNDPVDTNPASCCGNGYVYTTIGTDSVFIPNAFTPDGDGLNDLFWIHVTPTIDSMILVIRNDTGMVFASNNTSHVWYGWDGTNYQFGSNGPVPAGTYSYTFIGISNGISDTLDGTICLTRDGAFCPQNKNNCIMSSYFAGFDTSNPIDSLGQRHYSMYYCN